MGFNSALTQALVSTNCLTIYDGEVIESTISARICSRPSCDLLEKSISANAEKSLDLIRSLLST